MWHDRSKISHGGACKRLAPTYSTMPVVRRPCLTNLPCVGRDCSAPFHLAPYLGKPPAAAEAPDALEVQKLLAGMADRGADVAVVECASDGLEQGRCVSCEHRACHAGCRCASAMACTRRGRASA